MIASLSNDWVGLIFDHGMSATIELVPAAIVQVFSHLLLRICGANWQVLSSVSMTYRKHII